MVAHASTCIICIERTVQCSSVGQLRQGFARLQVSKLRAALQERQYTQAVYIEVDHWTDFPHVPWPLLNEQEQAGLNAHFRRCYAVGPYVKGERELPPRST